MFELLQQVRLALIQPEYLTEVISTFPACKSSTGWQVPVSDAGLYHSNPLMSNVVDIGERSPRGFPYGKFTFWITTQSKDLVKVLLRRLYKRILL